MTLALARLPVARLLRSPRAWMTLAAWALLAVIAAVAVRTRGQTSGADHVLRGSFSGVVFPLLTYAICGVTVGRAGMKKGIRGLVGLGARPLSAALAASLVAMAASALLGAALSALVCAVAHGPADPPLGADLVASTWIGALGGLAYGAYFCAGSAMGRGGGGRGLLLAADFLLGGAGGVGAVITPRGHFRSLLGGLPCADLSQRASSVVLLMLALAYLGLAVWLSRRAV